MAKLRGRKRLDRERYPGDQIKRGPVEFHDAASAFALAKRAVLADPRAAEAALNKASDEHDKAQLDLDPQDRRPFTASDAAVAVASAMSGSLRSTGKDDPTGASTALDRYYLWARFRGGPYRVTEEQFKAGAHYARLHGSVWGGLRGDLSELGRYTDIDLADMNLDGVVVPRRNPPAHLGHFIASTPSALESPAEMSPEEYREWRAKQWRRYRDVRSRLLAKGTQVTLAVEELVIEDHDPWWLSPAPERLGETEARARADRVFRERRQLKDGFDVLVEFFGTGDRSPPTQPAAAPGDPSGRRIRPRLDVISVGGVVEIDPGAIERAVERLKRRSAA